MANTAVIFYYNPVNRNGFNALASALEKDKYFSRFEVIFAVNETSLVEKIGTLFKKYDKIVVCFSFFSNQTQETKKFVAKLRKKFKDRIFLAAGGPHPTGDPCGTIKMGFDVVIIGEGEETFPAVLKKIILARSWKTEKGIAFRQGTKVKLTGMLKPIDINEYSAVSKKYDTFGSIEITRGCPFACSYCQTSHIFGRKLRHRSIKNIISAAALIKKRYTQKHENIYLRFISPNAFAYGSSDGKKIDLAKLEKLLSGLRKIAGKKIKIYFGTFPSEVRPEHVTKETVALIKKYCDNDNLVIGAQSGSKKILDKCKRGHTVGDIYNAAKTAISFGIKPNIDFIFGLPGETEEDAKRTADVMQDLIKIGARIHCHIFSPLPQTAFCNKPAGKIHPIIRKFLNKYQPQNIAYGNIK